MRNIYLRNSRIGSLCTRQLIEYYALGNTAAATMEALTDCPGKLHCTDDHNACLEPRGAEATLVNEFLAVYPSRMRDISRFAEARLRQSPALWSPIRISLRTVNRHFLLFGAFLWRDLAQPYLRRRAQETVDLLPQLAALGDGNEVTDMLVVRLAERYVRRANGAISITADDKLRYGTALSYLTERAGRLQGLSLARSQEHLSWAILHASIVRSKGREDRCYAARYLANRLAMSASKSLAER